MLSLAANAGLKHDNRIAPKHTDAAYAFRTTLCGIAQTIATVVATLATHHLMCFQEAVCGSCKVCVWQ